MTLSTEEGHPAIVESIRAGLVFDLKDAVGVDVIQAREEDFVRRAIDSWNTNPAIEVLGNTDPALIHHEFRRSSTQRSIPTTTSS